MNDPRQGFCFEHPNDLIWAAFEAYPDRLLPFFRLNPNFPTREEYERRVAQGFRGIKLHPRSQSFRIASARGDTYLRLGRGGWPARPGAHRPGGASIGRDVRHVVDAHPRSAADPGALGRPGAARTAAARAAVAIGSSSTLPPWIATSCGSCCSSIDPSKIAFGSDVPFHDPAEDLVQLLEVAEEVGLDPGDAGADLGREPPPLAGSSRGSARGTCALQSGRGTGHGLGAAGTAFGLRSRSRDGRSAPAASRDRS